ncbi:MAG: metallophosphoesterase [Pseudomonadota bacterium]
MTRILAFSDMHLSQGHAAMVVAHAGAADLVIGAGDFCNARQGLQDAMDLLAPVLPKAVLVPGNAESVEELRAAAGPATVLHGEGVECSDLQIFGLGYAVPVTPFGSWSCDLSEETAADMLAACAEADLMVLHSPPKGIADRSNSGASLGSTAIHDAIARIQPRLAVCGHIHYSWGQVGKIGQTHVQNLGPKPVWFTL